MSLLITDSMLFEGTGSTSSNMKIDMGYLGYYGISQNMIWDVSAPAQKVSFTQFPQRTKNPYKLIIILLF